MRPIELEFNTTPFRLGLTVGKCRILHQEAFGQDWCVAEFVEWPTFHDQHVVDMLVVAQLKFDDQLCFQVIAEGDEPKLGLPTGSLSMVHHVVEDDEFVVKHWGQNPASALRDWTVTGDWVDPVLNTDLISLFFDDCEKIGVGNENRHG